MHGRPLDFAGDGAAQRDGVVEDGFERSGPRVVVADVGHDQWMQVAVTRVRDVRNRAGRRALTSVMTLSVPSEPAMGEPRSDPATPYAVRRPYETTAPRPVRTSPPQGVVAGLHHGQPLGGLDLHICFIASNDSTIGPSNPDDDVPGSSVGRKPSPGPSTAMRCAGNRSGAPSHAWKR